MRKSARLTAILLSIFLAACGHPLIPPSVIKPLPSPNLTGHPILGVDLYISHNFSPQLIREQGWRSLVYIKRVLHAQSVGIVWDLYSPGAKSEKVSRTPITLAPAEVAVLTRQARALGLKVEYRPLIRVGPRWIWEGHISPPNQFLWFRSLLQAEAPYLWVAQRLHVEEFVVGTELRDLYGSPQWKWFLSRVRRVYHGSVSYASFQNDYVSQPELLPPTKQFGLDPYPPGKTLSTSASVQQILDMWNSYFGRVPEAILSNTMLQEVSIPALGGAYAHPWQWNMQGPPNELVQYRWFLAACKFVMQHHMPGIYFYEVNITDDPAHPLKFAAFFMGKRGAQAIQQCRSIFGTA